jgi:Outer membrane protein beta-barrel domain
MRQCLSTQMFIGAALTLFALPFQQAHTEDLLGGYAGGAIGQARVEATASELGNALFQENHSAFKAIIGLRPISLVGAEVAYMDFGHPSNIFYGATPVDVRMKGAAAFGVLYLPVPVVDVFLKAGLVRLQSTVTTTTGVCPPNVYCVVGATTTRLNRTDSGFAVGTGAQYKFGAWAARVEYERFNAAGGHPSLLSAGITWRFL